MDKFKCFVIENKETEERYLLPLKEWKENGTPEGYARRTNCVPLSEKHHDLPIYISK